MKKIKEIKPSGILFERMEYICVLMMSFGYAYNGIFKAKPICIALSIIGAVLGIKYMNTVNNHTLTKEEYCRKTDLYSNMVFLYVLLTEIYDLCSKPNNNSYISKITFALIIAILILKIVNILSNNVQNKKINNI